MTLLSIAQRIMSARAPDFIIGGRERPYMLRWWLIPRNRWFNIYLHRIVRSDDDRALHDHPWLNCSVVLAGGYREIMPAARGPFKYGDAVVVHDRKPGSVVFRSAKSAHRLIVEDGAECISLFITGPRIREWGFYAPGRWVHWQQFTDPTDPGLYRPDGVSQ